jgi:UDP-GlcNAc:undecaprenyl-phosphate GlcNAc-1-phosphate transferase
VREYILVFLVAAAVTYLLTVIAREIALRTGAVARVRDRDVHAEPVPYFGGLAMLGGLLAAYVVARQLPFLSESEAFVFRDAGIVLIAGTLLCAVGVLDDLFELDALTKLGGQVLAAALLIASGIQFVFFTWTDGQVFSLDPLQSALLTGLLVVTTVNAVNFVDGLDGLAGGVVAIGALSFFLFCYQLTRLNELTRATTAALLSAALAGVCIGFLVHNFHPARVFMGDSGSMLIGLVFSASVVTLSGQFSANAFGTASGSSLLTTLLPIALPVFILVVPLMDLFLAVVRRGLFDLRSPFSPDKLHLHHRLLEIGHSHRRAVLIMWLWAGLASMGTVLVSLYPGRTAVWVSLGVMALGTVVLTFLIPIVRKPRIGALHDS